MKEYVHSEKFMDVEDLEVSDEDGDTSRSNTIRENNRTPWKLPVDVMSKSFSGGDQNAQTVQMIQTMTRSNVQNMPTPDLEQTAAQSPGSMLQISSLRA